MNLEAEILTALINAYERSKVSKGQNKVHKDIKLDITHSVFDKHRNNDNGELDVSVQRIERAGFAKASYTRNGQSPYSVLQIRPCCDNAPPLYTPSASTSSPPQNPYKRGRPLHWA